MSSAWAPIWNSPSATVSPSITAVAERPAEPGEGIAQPLQPIAGPVGADRVRDAVGVGDQGAARLELDVVSRQLDVGEAAEQRPVLADAVDLRAS